MSPRQFPDEGLERISSAVATMEESLAVLVEKRELGRETYDRDSDVRDVVERRFVKATEAALDVGREILRYEGRDRPGSNPGRMRELADCGVLSPDLAEEMAEAARFRNVLAHTYGTVIDDDVVFAALDDLDRYRAFVHAVRDYLDSIGAFDGPP